MFFAVRGHRSSFSLSAYSLREHRLRGMHLARGCSCSKLSDDNGPAFNQLLGINNRTQGRRLFRIRGPRSPAGTVGSMGVNFANNVPGRPSAGSSP